jgi:hypothetical protein
VRKHGCGPHTPMRAHDWAAGPSRLRVVARDSVRVQGKPMPQSSPSPREESSVCEPGFDPCVFACRSRRGMPHLAAPAASSHTSGYRMDAPRARARGHVHACVLRPAHPIAGPRPGLWPAEPYAVSRVPTPWTSRRAALWPGGPNQRPCLRAAALEGLGHFDEHLVCGDAGEVFESVNPRGV